MILLQRPTLLISLHYRVCRRCAAWCVQRLPVKGDVKASRHVFEAEPSTSILKINSSGSATNNYVRSVPTSSTSWLRRPSLPLLAFDMRSLRPDSSAALALGADEPESLLPGRESAASSRCGRAGEGESRRRRFAGGGVRRRGECERSLPFT